MKVEPPNQPISAASEPDLLTMPGEPSPKKMKEGTECGAVVSVVAEAVKPTAMSALFGDVYITSVQKAKSPSINASEDLLTWWSEHECKYPSVVLVAKNYHTTSVQQHLSHLKECFQWQETL